MNETSLRAEHRMTVSSKQRLRLLVSWLWVGLPLGWGVWQTIVKSLPLFGSVGRS